MQLVEEGKVRLDDPVVRHLPWFKVPRTGERITIRHLLSHTAGITAGIDGTPEPRFQVWRLRDLPPGSAPGRRFHYSNVGFKAIGLMVEAIEGAPYPDVVRRRVLEPLGMIVERAGDHERHPVAAGDRVRTGPRRRAVDRRRSAAPGDLARDRHRGRRDRVHGRGHGHRSRGCC